MAARSPRDEMRQRATPPNADQVPGKKLLFLDHVVVLSPRVYYVSWTSNQSLPIHVLLHAFFTPYLTGFFPLERILQPHYLK